MALLAVLSAMSSLQAAPPNRQATASRAAREDAIRTIPFAKLDPHKKAKISAVIANTSIFRRLPIQVTDCDPDLYLFLVRHPEVVVNIWSVMGISNVELDRKGPGSFRATDGAGTLGDIALCYSSHDTQVIYAEGQYEGTLFPKPLKARCVLVLKSGYLQETNNRYYVSSRMDAFIQLEQVGVELLAKTFQPLITKSADVNFIEPPAFLGNISRTAELHPRGMKRLASRLTGLEPEVRARFMELAAQAAERNAERQAEESNPQPELVGAAPMATDKR